MTHQNLLSLLLILCNERDKMERKSLDEINGSVDVPNVYQSAFWQKFLAYSGPGALVAVGYMDPGNWLTSLAGGANIAISY